ncbi:MAG: right-handed parallel beta-helix repeat-containing protein [Patescibacteria group bacterium]
MNLTKLKIALAFGVAVALVIGGVALLGTRNAGVLEGPPEATEGSVPEKKEEPNATSVIPSVSKQAPAPAKEVIENEAAQKTRALIARAKEFLKDDPGREVFLCSADPCKISTQRFETKADGYHLDCGGLTLAPQEGVRVGISIAADGIIIENCGFQEFDTAIEIEGAGAVIVKNTITGSAGNGIVLTGQKALLFENTIEGNRGAGIFVARESNEHAIVDNVLRNNGTEGLHILGAGALTVIDNLITGNKSEGVWLSGNARENLLFENIIEENGGECGVFLGTTGNESPVGNTMIDNTTDKKEVWCT